MYIYPELKPKVFTEENQKLFLQIRDNVMQKLSQNNFILMEDAIKVPYCCDIWLAFACVDRLVELGEIKEQKIGEVMAQHRIFVKSLYN